MALRAMLWSFGGAEQDETGRVTLYSKHTIEAVKYMRELYRQCETPEVFSWDVSSNNRGILSGKLSFVQNAISVTRAAEKDNPEMSKQIQLLPPLKGPVRRIAAEHVMECYVIWNFAENKEGAKRFLARSRRQLLHRVQCQRVLQLPLLPFDGTRHERAPHE